jgi:elongation factor P
MNNETYEQISLTEDILQEKRFYLKENMDVTLLSVGDRVIDIEVPIFVELEIVETEPGVRGNTVSGGSKPAVCDTGLRVTVPLFLNVGDKIKIDTRTGEYVERV